MHPEEFVEWELAKEAKEKDDFLFLIDAIAIAYPSNSEKAISEKKQYIKTLTDDRLKSLQLYEDIYEERRKNTMEFMKNISKSKFKVKK